jgi:hypothetical protein
MQAVERYLLTPRLRLGHATNVRLDDMTVRRATPAKGRSKIHVWLPQLCAILRDDKREHERST